MKKLHEAYGGLCLYIRFSASTIRGGRRRRPTQTTTFHSFLLHQLDADVLTCFFFFLWSTAETNIPFHETTLTNHLNPEREHLRTGWEAPPCISQRLFNSFLITAELCQWLGATCPLCGEFKKKTTKTCDHHWGQAVKIPANLHTHTVTGHKPVWFISSLAVVCH